MKIAEDSLYSERISSPKALQEIQNEIASLKRSQSKLEDALLDAMMHGDECQSVLDAAQKTLDEMQALHANRRVVLIVEKDRLQEKLPTLETKRKDAAGGIEPGQWISSLQCRGSLEIVTKTILCP